MSAGTYMLPSPASSIQVSFNQHSDISPSPPGLSIIVAISLINWISVQLVGYEGSVVFSVHLELRTLRRQGVVVFHSLISGG